MKTRAAFIFSLFPCYDEVFILREMAALDRLLDLTIFSLKRREGAPVRHALSLPLREKTVYSGFLFDRGLLRANLSLLLRRPGTYLRALADLVRLNFRDPEFLIKSLFVFPQAVYFASLCRERKIEMVHGQWATYPATVALVISRINGIPFSFTGHAHDIYLKTTGLPGKLRRARFALTCTRSNKSYLLSLAPALNPEKVHVIYHGVDLKNYQFRPARPEPRPLRIVSVGSLFECKGFEYLIAAGAILKKEDFPFRMRIVGGGYLEAKLKGLVRRGGLEEVIEFSGYQSQEEMPAHYRWADLFVLPAVLRIHWGIPNVLLESLAVGVPVACTPLPSLPELIGDPPCGFTIPEKDPAAIADLIKQVSRRPGLLREYGKAGRRKIEEKWDIARTSREIAGLLDGFQDILVGVNVI